MEKNPKVAWRIAYHQVFSSNEVAEIRRSQDQCWTQGTIEDGHVQAGIRSVSVQAFPIDLNIPWQNRLYSYIEAANTAIWKFDIRGFHHSEPLQFLRYTQDEHYEWHIDHDSQSSTRKLTFVLQLSPWESYCGGELQLFPPIHHASSDVLGRLGTLIVFPVYVPHRVTPIVSGVRDALVGWVHGPSFR